MWKALVEDATHRGKMCDVNARNSNFARYLAEEKGYVAKYSKK